jgi:hypothetical protein
VLLDTGLFNEQTLIEHWDGTSWMVVTSPNTDNATDNRLNALACVSDSECWAVGHFIESNDPTTNQTLVELWDGSSWNIVSSANTSVSEPNSLNAISCTSSFECEAVGYYGNGHTLQAMSQFMASLKPVRVVSRKTHGGAGPFEVDLSSGQIECRSGGPAGDYTMVFVFANTLTHVESATITAGVGSITSSGIDPNDSREYIVNLTGITDAQKVTVTLTGLADSQGNSSNGWGASLSVLIADVNGSRSVEGNDVSSVQSSTRQPLTTSNFRADVNADGRIDGNDVSATQAQTRTRLP